MASTSAAEPPSAMGETPNWLEMPQDLMQMILERLGAVEILNSAQKVCTTWRRISKDPAMWKVIDLHRSEPSWGMVLEWYKFQGSGEVESYDYESLAKQAVHRSCGELIDINIEGFGTDGLLDHISRCSSKLNSLRIAKCYNITGSCLSDVVKRLPHLEKLHIFYIKICVEDIELIGRSCPLLKSFKMYTDDTFSDITCDDDALAIAIANNMPELHHLQLFGSEMTNNGLQAILHGCPHLESLDLRRCSNLDLGGNLGKLCMERIIDLKLPLDSSENCGFAYESSEYDLYDYSGEFDHDAYGSDEFF